MVAISSGALESHGKDQRDHAEITRGAADGSRRSRSIASSMTLRAREVLALRADARAVGRSRRVAHLRLRGPRRVQGTGHGPDGSITAARASLRSASSTKPRRACAQHPTSISGSSLRVKRWSYPLYASPTRGVAAHVRRAPQVRLRMPSSRSPKDHEPERRRGRRLAAENCSISADLSGPRDRRGQGSGVAGETRMRRSAGCYGVGCACFARHVSC